MLDTCEEFYAYLPSIGYNYADTSKGITSMSHDVTWLRVNHHLCSQERPHGRVLAVRT